VLTICRERFSPAAFSCQEQPMHSPCRIALAVICVATFAACEQAPNVVLSPTASIAGTPASNLEVSPSDHWGALPQPLLATNAAQESGFACGLGPFGVADRSHATQSASGNQTLVCQGQAAATVVLPDKAQIFEGFGCALHFDGTITTRSKLVFTPSGHLTLTCHGKK
jgi:hypothetical protein